MVNLFIKLSHLGNHPKDNSDERLQKQFLVFLALFMGSGGLTWGTISIAYKLYLPAVFPLSYTFITIINLIFFAQFKRFGIAKNIQTTISLILPFIFQWSLGGFYSSGLMMYWAILALLASLTYQSAKNAFVWLVLFSGLTVVSGYFDSLFVEHKPDIMPDFSMIFIVLIIVFVSTIVFFLISYIVKKQRMLQSELFKQQKVTDEKNEELNSQNASILKQNSKIEHQKELLNEQYNFTQSSIKYAKRIQEAILPLQERFDAIGENFIIYEPKDIVSGDFYWCTRAAEYCFLVVVDCTGHGVPGAFMSLIGNRILRELVVDNKIYSPKEILSSLNKKIIEVLKQETSENTDGMDVCMVRVDKKNENKTIREIVFCGAKRDLYFYDNDDKKLNLVKGERRSIGGPRTRNNIQFTNTTISISQGDIIYLSSDGYSDQNNECRKRFGSQKLMAVLDSISEVSMADQKKILTGVLDKYKKNEKQRDDITMVGIRF